MDLLKAFDIINHDPLIAKLKTLGFSFNTLSHIYLQNNMRKLEKITHSVEEILADVPKSSILGPLLSIILQNKIFFFWEQTFLCNYTKYNVFFLCLWFRPRWSWRKLGSKLIKAMWMVLWKLYLQSLNKCHMRRGIQG